MSKYIVAFSTTFYSLFLNIPNSYLVISDSLIFENIILYFVLSILCENYIIMKVIKKYYFVIYENVINKLNELVFLFCSQHHIRNGLCSAEYQS